MSNAEENVDEFIGDKNDAEAVRWFGWYSLVVTLVSGYMLDTSSNSWI